MDFLKLYDSLTTSWGRFRAHIISHAMIVAALIWLIGFKAPLTGLRFVDPRAIAGPATPLLENVGLLALLTFGAALILGAYAVMLEEAGNLLLRLLYRIFPPQADMSGWERSVASDSWFTIAATLPGGRYQPRDLPGHASRLLSYYMRKDQEAFRLAGDRESWRQRDATTHLRNALVFIAVWSLAPLLLPGHPLTLEIVRLFGPGLVLLGGYALVSHARVASAQLYYWPGVHETLATLIARDPDHSDRLAAAHSNPHPYLELVSQLRERGVEPRKPSLPKYLRYRLNLPVEIDLRRTPSLNPLREWLRFGQDSGRHEAYDDPEWLLRYARWRLAVAADSIERALRSFVERYVFRAR